MANTYSAGIATAYGAAVRGGYTGTYDEWCALMADYATVGEQAAQSAQAAQTSADNAAASESNAATSAGEATAQADAAATSATNAAQSATDAAGSASAASTSATNAAASATAAAGSASGAETSATNAAASEAAAADSATTAAQELGRVQAEGEAQTAAITAEGERVLESIPADYTALSDEVGDLKSAFDDLETYVRDLSPSVTAGPSAVVSVPDAAPLEADSVVVDIEPVQSGSGDASPDNVRPIAGWTGAEVTRCGKNLVPPLAAAVTDRGLTFTPNSDGSITVTGTATANVIENISRITLPAGSYVISGSPSGGSNDSYRADMRAVDGTQTVVDYGDGKSFTLNESKLIDYVIRIASGYTASNLVFSPMIRPAEITDATYEPYQAAAYPVAFPAAAGTVYGGTLDLTTGRLTVDKAMVIVGTDTGNLNGNGQTALTTRAIFTANQGKKPGRLNIASDKFHTGIAEQVGIMSGRDATGDVEFYLSATVPNTAQGVRSWFADNPTQLCYELATPTTYDIDPVAVALLRRNNTLWADCGDTTLTYRQDVATLLSALTAPDETDMTADTNYAVNSFFMVGGTLYRATAAIATGETIQPGANCVATSIAEQLTAIYARLA